jgi:voltage-gated potassium channel
MRALRHLKYLAVALVALVVAGAAGFHYLEGWSWFDSTYMVVITLTTIGYGEVHPLSHNGKIFNMAFIVAGVALATVVVGSLTQYLLEFELTKVLGRRKMGRDIARLSHHYIICGAGRVGRRAARELARRPVPFVVIENDEARLQNLEPEWLMIRGDATQERVLRDARIEHAAGLVAATTTDATNIYIVLTARSLSSKLRIIARASEEAAEKHLLKAGADSVVSPYDFAGHRIAQSFLRPNVLNFLDLATAREGRMEMVIEEIHVSAESPFAGRTVGSSLIHRDFAIIILAIKHEQGKTIFNPTADAVIHAGDFLIVMGEPGNMARLEATASNNLERP